MILNYTQHESTVKPLEVDIIGSPNFVYLTKNVREEIRKDSLTGTEATWYVYDEAKVTKDEYIEILTEENKRLEAEKADWTALENAYKQGVNKI